MKPSLVDLAKTVFIVGASSLSFYFSWNSVNLEDEVIKFAESEGWRNVEVSAPPNFSDNFKCGLFELPYLIKGLNQRNELSEEVRCYGMLSNTLER